MKEYLIKITTNKSLNTVKKYIEKKYQWKEGAYCHKKEKYIPATYIYELPERGKSWVGLNNNLECLRKRFNTASKDTGHLSFYYKDHSVELELNNRYEEGALGTLLIDNKLNGSDPIAFYENGFRFELTDYSIEISE